uniref:Transmembrane protein 115 n=1 Tax=Caligus rogercresseyi TaxID=217165 RepID=C1BNZ9_CALRO|nr:Transmembrane protein 115 [Caligus rogercresseyi]|eukprot:TRINITY_DN2409_c0_g1_i1.p1 TRINITY_DN2409_c0_g1~~TRINITY_DN2409_c0_g1_i1.p1  ORF type:complete len:380 (+),score=89.21 TRINITY_DN2409_c0_g1_i1:168-1307(+)
MAVRFFSRTLPYMRAQIAAFLGNSSVFVKSISLLLFLLHFVSYSESLLDYCVVVPGYFLPPKFYLWTSVTHALIESSLLGVLLDTLVLFLVGKLVEPLWGLREMGLFFAVVNIGVAVLSGIFYYLLYMLTFNESLLFKVRIHGMSGYIAGASVAVKQILPDVVLYQSPLGKITNRHVPLSLFLTSLILYAVGLLSGSTSTMIGTGLLVSWTYLRFYQVHSNGSRGDMSESFGFPGFFPNVFQPPVSLLSNSVFTILVRLRICRKPVRKYELGSANSISLSLPGAESHDTERRRQIALKALSERLSKSEAGGGSSGPTEWPKAEEKKPEEKSVKIPITAEEEREPLLMMEEEINQVPSVVVEPSESLMKNEGSSIEDIKP